MMSEVMETEMINGWLSQWTILAEEDEPDLDNWQDEAMENQRNMQHMEHTM